MMGKFPDFLSDEYDAQRAIFYAALYGPDCDAHKFDLMNAALTPSPSGVHQDKDALVSALNDLQKRAMLAHDILGKRISPDRSLLSDAEHQGIFEVLSDISLLSLTLIESLSDFGPTHGTKLEIKKRGRGAPGDRTATVRKGMAVAEVIERRVEGGEQLESVIRSMMPDPDRAHEDERYSEKYLRFWLSERRRVRAKISKIT